MKLSIVVPAHNEKDCLGPTVCRLHRVLQAEAIAHEIVVVNDHSTDGTPDLLRRLQAQVPALLAVSNSDPPGFGRAVRAGLDRTTGEAIAIFMADGSDRPEDLVRFYRALQSADVDCVFGTRFTRGARCEDYPLLKLALNRTANTLIQLLFAIDYNDVTNAFKLYRREVIAGTAPLESAHFNLTVELPLKAIARGYRFTILPNDWIGRRTGESKLRLRETAPSYLFTLLKCFTERFRLTSSRGRRRPVHAAQAVDEAHE